MGLALGEQPPIWTNRRKRTLGQEVWRSKYIYLGLLPTFAFLLVFCYYPPLSGIWYSFRDWEGGYRSWFCGLQNYAKMLVDPNMGTAWKNVALLTVGDTLIKGVAIPLLVAVLIFHLKKARAAEAYRFGFVLPMVVPGIAGVLLWKNLYLPQGVINKILEMVGLGTLTQPWLSNPDVALGAIWFAGFPWVSGIGVLILLAGLLNIDNEILDATAIDGANSLQRLLFVEMPLIKGQIKIQIVLGFIGGIQNWFGPLIFTKGGPWNSTTVPGLEMYTQLTQFANAGYASAIGVSIAVVAMLITLINMRFLKSAD